MSEKMPSGAQEMRSRERRVLTTENVLAAILSIVAVGTIAGLVMPVNLGPRPGPRDGRSELRGIVVAAQMYADAEGRGAYPWIRGARAELRSHADARAVLALLYERGYIEDPALFVSPTTADRPAEPIVDPSARAARFRLEEGQCSFTWRKRPTRAADDSKTPISGTMPPPPGEALPLGGLLIAYKGGNVVFLDEETLRDRNNERVRRAKAELVGWEDVGGWRLDEEGR